MKPILNFARNWFSLAVVAIMLSSCASTIVSATNPIPGQDTDIAVAQLSYSILANVGTVYLKFGNPSVAIKTKIKTVDAVAYGEVKIARKAVADKDNAAIAVALDLLNKDNADFKTALTQQGVATP